MLMLAGCRETGTQLKNAWSVRLSWSAPRGRTHLDGCERAAENVSVGLASYVARHSSGAAALAIAQGISLQPFQYQ